MWSIKVRIGRTSKHAEFLLAVGTPAYCICWGLQLLVPSLGNLLMLKSLTFRTSFSVFHCVPALSISRTREAITKTIPCDRRKLIKLMLKKMHVSASLLTPDWSVRTATPSDNMERTARSGAVVETIYMSRPWRAQCTWPPTWQMNAFTCQAITPLLLCHLLLHHLLLCHLLLHHLVLHHLLLCHLLLHCLLLHHLLLHHFFVYKLVQLEVFNKENYYVVSRKCTQAPVLWSVDCRLHSTWSVVYRVSFLLSVV